MFEELKNDAVGLAVLREWLGDDGVPVSHEDATRRSYICVGCHENKAPRWWDFAKNKVARAIKKHLEVKHRVGLGVDVEARLGICAVCRCCLPLKVHVPIQHINAHLDDDVRTKFPDFCWVCNETNK